MDKFNYALSSEEYTWKNALLWGNFLGHCKKAREGNFFHRVIHVIIAAIELPPLIGQIASIFEKVIVLKFANSKKEIPSPRVSKKKVSLISKKSELYKKAAKLIADADVLFISAGAGMGVPGGLGTFRGAAAGVWPPLEKLGLKFQEMSNPSRFREDDTYGPNLAWSFWKWRYAAYTGTEPHKGYKHLLNWSKGKKQPPFVFTTNIDNHFLRAGFDRVLERHGSVQFLQCSREDSNCPKYDEMWLPEKNQIEDLQIDPETNKVTSQLPHCAGCGKVARPTVLMFNDGYVLKTRIKKQMEDFDEWKQEISQSGKLKMVAIEIGAGIAISTARLESESISKKFSCPLIRINPEHPKIIDAASDVEHISISAGAGEALKQINKEIEALKA